MTAAATRSVVGSLEAEFGAAAAEVLHERVPGADHPCGVELCQATYRPQPGLQAVIGYEQVGWRWSRPPPARTR